MFKFIEYMEQLEVIESTEKKIDDSSPKTEIVSIIFIA